MTVDWTASAPQAGDVQSPGIQIQRLSTLGYGVYAEHSHAALRAAETDPSRVLTYPFVALETDDEGSDREPWPGEVHRTVSLRARNRSALLAACRAGTFLAFLPDVLGESEGLTRLEVVQERQRDLYVCERQRLHPDGAAQLISDALEQFASRHC